MNHQEMIKQLSRGFELAETHISWVLLGDGVVYKIKKPQKFTFIDFSTLEKRKFYCEEEVRLNSELSPEIYFGVVPICIDENGNFKIGRTSTPVEYAVKMKRIPSDKQLDNFIKAGSFTKEHAEKTAEKIFEFHNTIRIIKKEEHNYPDILFNICTDDLKIVSSKTTESALLNFLNNNRKLFFERQENGNIRECHGDIRAENVYWDERPIINRCTDIAESYAEKLTVN